MKWFAGVKTVEELRKVYRELLKKYHPDKGGSVEITQEINAEYDRLFDVLNRNNTSDNKDYTYEEDEQFKAVLNAIIGYNMTIEIIGSWIWCFDCYAYKDPLKSLGFKWCGKKKAWVWHTGEYQRNYKSEIPLDDIRAKYGSHTVSGKSKQYILRG